MNKNAYASVICALRSAKELLPPWPELELVAAADDRPNLCAVRRYRVMISRIGVAGLILGLAAIGGACAEQRVETLQSALEPMDRLVAIDGRREGSALALATISSAERPASTTNPNAKKAHLNTERVLLIADEDAAAVRLLDAKTHRQIAITPLRGRPSQLLIASDGRAYVALRDHHRLVALELQRNTGKGDNTTYSLKEVRDYPTAAEPVGLAMSPDGDTLLVVSGWGRQLQALSLSQGRQRFSLRNVSTHMRPRKR